MAEAERYLKNPGSRPFFLEEVHGNSYSESRLERSFVALSAAEYGRVFGTPGPRAKDPRTPTIRLQLPSGGSELLYVFKDPDSPYRKLTLCQGVGEERVALLCSRDDHHHHAQGAEILKGAEGRRWSESNEGPLQTGISNYHLSTIEEFKVKMAKRWGHEAIERKDGEAQDTDTQSSDEEVGRATAQRLDDGQGAGSAPSDAAAAALAAAAATKAQQLSGTGGASGFLTP